MRPGVIAVYACCNVDVLLVAPSAVFHERQRVISSYCVINCLKDKGGPLIANIELEQASRGYASHVCRLLSPIERIRRIQKTTPPKSCL